MRRWRLQAGRYDAWLEAPEEIGPRLRALLVDLESHAAGPTAGRVCVEQNGNLGYAIRSDDRVWRDAVAEADAGDEVVRMLLHAALDAEETDVHIHAGAVGFGVKTAILAGWPAAGKSTAIASLLGSGFSYVTDERLAVAADGRSVAGFAKPISLLAGSFDIVSALAPGLAAHGERTETTWQLPASAIGPVAPAGFRSPSVLVLLRHRAGAALRVSAITADRVAARLLGDSPDVIVRGAAGARAIVALASSTPAVELEYSETEDLVAAMYDLLDEAPRDGAGAGAGDLVELGGSATSGHEVPASAAAIDASQQFAIVEGVSVWVLEDRAVAYLHASGRVVELDETSTVWVQLLDGDQQLDALIGEVAQVTGADRSTVDSIARQLVHSLWAAGVVGPCGAPR